MQFAGKHRKKSPFANRISATAPTAPAAARIMAANSKQQHPPARSHSFYCSLEDKIRRSRDPSCPSDHGCMHAKELRPTHSTVQQPGDDTTS
ncbi:hypothetical protein NUW54_g14414 [Trametes sanguinea]|uniref:Uncharacterized protein n=1 Tax=Trametes sanguinea TaxID=158606 RepID=A0ACC1MDH4_9APHY|nr:hypothetical protein NUW54_g14414 [Trametes sanguinea]